MVAVPKGVDVKPRACARDHADHTHRSRSQPPLSLVEIGSARQFDVGGIAHEHGHGEAGPLGESAIIGEAVEPEFGRLSVGIQDRPLTQRLEGSGWRAAFPAAGYRQPGPADPPP